MDLEDSFVSQEYILNGPGRLACIPRRSMEWTWETHLYLWEVQGMHPVGDLCVYLGGSRDEPGILTYYPWKVYGVHPVVDPLTFLRHIWNGTGRLTSILET